MRKGFKCSFGLEQKKSILGFCLCLPIISGILCFYLAPFWMAVWRSLHQGMSNLFVGLQNYAELFSNAAFRLAAYNTVRFWLLALPLNLVLGFALALLCESTFSQRRKALLFFPAMVPAACAVVALALLMPAATLGGITGVVLQVGVFLWKSTGYTVLILAAALHNIPQEILESAACCGANRWQTFWAIQWPILLPAVGASLLLSFLNSFKVFRESYLLWGTHPDNALYGLQHFLYNNFANMNYPRLAAASVLLILAIVGLCILVWLISKRKGRYYE